MKEVYRPPVLIFTEPLWDAFSKDTVPDLEELKASEKDEDVDKQFEIAILALGGLHGNVCLMVVLGFIHYKWL